MSITADEVNFLIRRYLQESGFQHTAFMFSSDNSVCVFGADACNLSKGQQTHTESHCTPFVYKLCDTDKIVDYTLHSSVYHHSSFACCCTCYTCINEIYQTAEKLLSHFCGSRNTDTGGGTDKRQYHKWFQAVIFYYGHFVPAV